MITVIMPMFIFALIGAISPGPVNIIAAGSGANFGFRRTIPHILGAAIAYTLIVLLAGLGLNQWLTLFPEIGNTLQYAGSAFLLYMSYKIAAAVPLRSEKMTETKQPPSLIEGALAQGLNPKAWLVSMSGISLFVTVHAQSMLYLLIFCIISFTLCLFGVSTWAAAGHSIRSLLSTTRRQIGFNILMGLMLSGTVVSILFIQ
ncbi:LysE family translocator [Psychromonas ossibalaenae]|uniref:LysE family translocator n=1 Tax=Psychromonas ossibalaenae TaxID=444922 RepID=UPI00037D557A|nr:LysE family translocator [Psychromonas ossibalaenae]